MNKQDLPGQITPDSTFGLALIHLARRATSIVEIGTWHGGGSTRCLWLGMIADHQRLVGVEANREFAMNAILAYQDDRRVTILWGSIVRQEQMDQFEHPTLTAHHPLYKEDKLMLAQAPDVLPLLPAQIDLLLIDGGEWTADHELDLLKARSNIIALDDTNPASSHKNSRNRTRLLDEGWIVMGDNPHDRHGWFIAKRP